MYCTATATALAGGKPASHAMRVEEMIAGISGTLSRRHGIAHVRLVFDPASATAPGVKDLDLRLVSRASSSYKTFFFRSKKTTEIFFSLFCLQFPEPGLVRRQQVGELPVRPASNLQRFARENLVFPPEGISRQGLKKKKVLWEEESRVFLSIFFQAWSRARFSVDAYVWVDAAAAAGKIGDLLSSDEFLETAERFHLFAYIPATFEVGAVQLLFYCAHFLGVVYLY